MNRQDAPYKKVFVVAFIGIIIAFIAYATAQDSQTTATTANQTANNITQNNTYINYSINLSNVTLITANGSLVATTIPDSSGNISNISVTGGLTATYI